MNLSFINLFSIGIYVVCLVLSNLFSPKLIEIHDIYISAGTFTIPIAYAILDAYTEVFGYAPSRNLIYAGIFSELFFSSATTFIAHIEVLNTPIDQSYALVTQHLLRGSIAFLMGSMIGLTVNSKLLRKLKFFFKSKFYIARSIAASSIGELIQISITFSIAFLGIFPIKHIIIIGVVSYSYKFLCGILLAYPSLLLVKLFNKPLIASADFSSRRIRINVKNNKK